MQKEKHLHNRLQWLAALTAAAMAGIVCFQFYWLRVAYREQQSYFVTDTRNAVNGTVIRNKINAAMRDYGIGRIGKATVKDMLTYLALVSEPHGYNNATVSSSVQFGIPVKDTSLIKGLPLRRHVESSHSYKRKDAVMMVTKGHSYGKKDSITFYSLDTDSLWLQPKAANFDSLTKWLKNELRKRDIYPRAELALLDKNGIIVQSTINTQDFKNIVEKSPPSRHTVMAGTKEVQLQAAFPDAGLAVTRRMGRMLALTGLLIILAAVSFAWLLRLFFRQKRLADIRNDFMNNMTHELQTPISSVSVALQMMQDGRHPVSDEMRLEYVTIAQGELSRLTMLVEKVLKMAAFERSEIRITPELFAAAHWLQEILKNMQPMFSAAGAQINISVHPEEVTLYADKTHLTTVIHNLLENALKYNDKQPPEVSISIREENDSVTLKVTDNGRGIPAVYLNKVFDQFFRVPAGDRHNTKGYGLGLSYVKAIAALHGGSVSVKSRLVEGSNFIVVLPKKPSV